MAARLGTHRYGKHQVRVSKVRRPRVAAAKDERHEFVEFSVNVELEGDFDAAYTQADNRLVVATDTCKNIVYAIAKQDPLASGESFGLALVTHFVATYPHVSACEVSLRERVWTRLRGCPHGFISGQSGTPTASVRLERGAAPRIRGGVDELLIAKTTESGFADFHESVYRTLPDTDDRILATSATIEWGYSQPMDDYAAPRRAVLDAVLAKFLDHYSRSVQQTLFLMGEAALAAVAEVAEVSLTMPNKHHLLADLKRLGMENDNEVFVVTDEPMGFISATVTR